jgi:hypothetical protein
MLYGGVTPMEWARRSTRSGWRSPSLAQPSENVAREQREVEADSPRVRLMTERPSVLPGASTRPGLLIEAIYA